MQYVDSYPLRRPRITRRRVAAPVAYHARRWPIVLLVLAGLLAAAIGVKWAPRQAISVGVDRLVALALTALRQRDRDRRGDRAATGPLYFLDGGASGAAGTAAETTVLEWAAALGRKGQVDAAVALYRSVASPPSFRRKALDALAALLLKTAAADAAAGRLRERDPAPPARSAGSRPQPLPACSRARCAIPVDQAGEARLLVAAGAPPTP